MHRVCLSVFGVLFACSGSAVAGFVNGAFESGLTGWGTIGDVTTDSTFGGGPTQGSFQAMLSSVTIQGDFIDPFSGGSEAVSAADLETFLGLSSGSLSSLDFNGGYAIEGSAIKQTFTANVGDILSFDYNFLTEEFAEDAFRNDLAFLTLSSPELLADTFFPSLSKSSQDLDVYSIETGYSTFSRVITVAGTYTIGLGVLDISGSTDELDAPNAIPSALLLDNFQLYAGGPEPIPEPTTLALLASGLPALLLLRRLRRAKVL